MAKKYAPATTGNESASHKLHSTNNPFSEAPHQQVKRALVLHCIFNAARRRVVLCRIVEIGLVVALALLQAGGAK